MTPAEAKLWRHLRAGRFEGAKFRRQTPIDIFVADFNCRTAMLVIEIDGDTHGDRATADARRTKIIEANGWKVVRFTNADVMSNMEGVLQSIASLMPLSPASAGGTAPRAVPAMLGAWPTRRSPEGERED